jgi:hypothetical protein
MKLSKETIGLAGEYAVASEICRWGLYCQLTLGNYKGVDLLVDPGNGKPSFRVSVKAKQGGEWPSIAWTINDNDFFVFVDYAGKSDSERPDFYIVDKETWDTFEKSIVDKHLAKGRVLNKEKGKIIWPDGWKGINIKPQMIEGSKDRWDRIVS